MKNDRPCKLYIVGGENNGWALDTDVRLFIEAATPFFELVKSPFQADYIHSVSLPSDCRNWKCDRFVGVFPCNPMESFREQPYLKKSCKETHIVVQSKGAYEDLQKEGYTDVTYIPYIADLHHFSPVTSDSVKSELREKYGIPQNAFVIGSFVRDTEGMDLKSPKLVKGPDIFCEILQQSREALHAEQRLEEEDRLLVLLAGPRRFWIRRRLEELGIAYCFIGTEVPEGQDDVQSNVLPAEVIADLMHISDCMIVSSRSEGGPRAILEAAAAKVPIISSRVGIAPDILEPECIYEETKQAVDLLLRHMKEGYLDSFIDRHYETVMNISSPEVVGKLYFQYYQKLASSQNTKKWMAVLQILKQRVKNFVEKRL